jgi:hypothetical protein
MQNDTDLIFEAYKEIYSEGWKDWKDVTAALLMMVGAAAGIGKVGSEMSQRLGGYPELKTPEIKHGVATADEKTIKNYLEQMMHISELNSVPQQHLEALRAISKNVKFPELSAEAKRILSIMERAGNKSF